MITDPTKVHTSQVVQKAVAKVYGSDDDASKQRAKKDGNALVTAPDSDSPEYEYN